MEDAVVTGRGGPEGALPMGPEPAPRSNRDRDVSGNGRLRLCDTWIEMRTRAGA
jgi:hypothetical protein